MTAWSCLSAVGAATAGPVALRFERPLLSGHWLLGRILSQRNASPQCSVLGSRRSFPARRARNRAIANAEPPPNTSLHASAPTEARRLLRPVAAAQRRTAQRTSGKRAKSSPFGGQALPHGDVTMKEARLASCASAFAFERIAQSEMTNRTSGECFLGISAAKIRRNSRGWIPSDASCLAKRRQKTMHTQVPRNREGFWCVHMTWLRTGATAHPGTDFAAANYASSCAVWVQAKNWSRLIIVFNLTFLHEQNPRPDERMATSAFENQSEAPVTFAAKQHFAQLMRTVGIEYRCTEGTTKKKGARAHALRCNS